MANFGREHKSNGLFHWRPAHKNDKNRHYWVIGFVLVLFFLSAAHTQLTAEDVVAQSVLEGFEVDVPSDVHSQHQSDDVPIEKVAMHAADTTAKHTLNVEGDKKHISVQSRNKDTNRAGITNTFEWVTVDDLRTLFSPTDLASTEFGSGPRECKRRMECCIGAGSKGVGTYWLAGHKSSCWSSNFHRKYKVWTATEDVTLRQQRMRSSGNDEMRQRLLGNEKKFKEENEAKLGVQRDPYSLLQALEHLPNGTKVAFTGDSMTRQSFDAAICDFERHGVDDKLLQPDVNVDWLSHLECRKENWRLGVAENFITNVTWANTVSGYKHNVVVSIVKQYLPDWSHNDWPRICSSVDVLIVNFGHHFKMNPTPEELVAKKGTKGNGAYADAYDINVLAPKIVKVLKEECIKKHNTVVVWREQISGHPHDAHSKCQAHESTYNTQHGWRDVKFEEAFNEFDMDVVHTAALVSGNEVTVKRNSNHVVWLDLLTKYNDLWDVHMSGKDCTHICYSPYTWEPVWEELYTAFKYEKEAGRFESRPDIVFPKQLYWNQFAVQSPFCRVPNPTINAKVKTPKPKVSVKVDTSKPAVHAKIETNKPAVGVKAETPKPLVSALNKHSENKDSKDSSAVTGFRVTNTFKWVTVDDLTTMYSPIDLRSTVFGAAPLECKRRMECCIGAGSTGVGTVWIPGRKNSCWESNFHRKYKVWTATEDVTLRQRRVSALQTNSRTRSKNDQRLLEHKKKFEEEEEEEEEEEDEVNKRGIQRDPYSLLQALEHLPNGTKVAFTGDSMTRQNFDAAICEFERFGANDERLRKDVNVKWLSHQECHKETWRFGVAENYVTNITWTNSVSGYKHDVLISIVKQYLPSVSHDDWPKICAAIDVLIVNFGHHFNNPDAKEKANNITNSLNEWAPRIVKVLKEECIEKHNTVVVWREQISGHKHDKKVKCEPHDLATYTTTIGSRDVKFEKTFREFGIDVVHTGELVSGNDMAVGSNVNHVVWLDVFTKYTALWDIHMTGKDCTHICYSPYTWEPVWEEMYTAFKYEKEAGRFESRADAVFPKQVNWNQFAIQSTYCHVH